MKNIVARPVGLLEIDGNSNLKSIMGVATLLITTDSQNARFQTEWE